MNYEKKKNFIVNIVFYTIVAAISFFAVKYVAGWIMPFIIAFCVSALINPVAANMSRSMKVNKKFSACFCAFMFYSIGVGLVALLGFGLYKSLKNWFFDLPAIFENNIEPFLASVFTFMQNTLANFDPELSNSLSEFAAQFVSNAGSVISGISVSAIGWLSSYITKIPFFIVGVLISVIATFFICSDYENIKDFIIRQIPEKWHCTLNDIKNYGIITLVQYGKSYLLIMLITFCELCLALWIMGVENFVVISIITAVFDILPVLGSGGVLIPWGVFALVQGDMAFGIGILVVYIVITVVRQFIEPKIVGEQVGLPPVVTLLAMFLGVRLMGVLGLLGFPVVLVVLKRLNDSGRIKLFK